MGILGMAFDIGIELGKLLYWNVDQSPQQHPVRVNRQRLRVLGLLALNFFGGGVLGALGFKYLGYLATLPLALLLVLLAAVPALDDLSRLGRRLLRRR